MIYSIKGEIINIEANLAVIETGGIGYACRTTANTLSGLKVGNETKLLTYMNVREDLVELFGFGDKMELNAFKLLISVSGVGPKAALSILSDLSPQGFALCIASGDTKLLTRSQGIGTKIAQRIVLELKDKIDKQKSFSGIDITVQKTATGNNNASEATSALLALGFSAGQAVNALDGLDASLPVPEMIKAALKRLA